MPKDILLYGQIWEYNVLYFFNQISEALEEDPAADLQLRVNCEGGSPEYGMSLIEKVQELNDQMEVKVGAMAHSMAFFILCYIDSSRVECIDTTQAILHRAAYPDWMEKSERFKDSIYEQILAKTNKDLEKALRNKIDVSVLEALPQFKDKNLTLKDIFSMEKREEVLLTASDLKKLGLVSRVNRISPSKSAELKAQVEAFKKCRSIEEFRMAAQNTNPSQSQKTDTMTIEQLKSEFPAVYAAIFQLGKEAGSKSESERTGAWMAFMKIDAEAAAKGIKEGKEVTVSDIAEFSQKAIASATQAAAAADSPPAVVPPGSTEPPKAQTDKEKALASFEANVKGFLKKTPVGVS